MDGVEQIIAARARDLGDDFAVDRVLPAPGRRAVGGWTFLDHFGPLALPPGRGLDVRPHPHVGLATVTYLFEGRIVHRDSLGNVRSIEPGAVNWMTAGRGIVHSERSSPEDRARENRVLGTPGGAPPHYVNGGSGRAYGLELLLQAKLGERYSGFASYTLSRSTRRDGAGAPERLFDRDQTHNLSVGATAKLGYGFQVGARFRYVTGSPYSAVHGAVYDATTDTYRPLYGVLNDARNPAFHQLDLRVDKLWHVGPVDLTAYLELMNTYNAQNQESRRYSFDYRESSSVVGLPFFPNLGLRGEL